MEDRLQLGAVNGLGDDVAAEICPKVSLTLVSHGFARLLH